MYLILTSGKSKVTQQKITSIYLQLLLKLLLVVLTASANTLPDLLKTFIAIDYANTSLDTNLNLIRGFWSYSESIVAIRKPERQVRKASHCRRKQQ